MVPKLKRKLIFLFPKLRKLSQIYVGILMILHKRKGHNSSGLLFNFWLLLTFMAIPQLLHEIRNMNEENFVNDFNITQLQFYNYITYFLLLSLLTILNCFADSHPTHSDFPSSEKPCPENHESFLSKVHFFWFSVICYRGFFRPLTEKDLFDIRPQDTCAELHPPFDEEFSKSVERNKR